MHLVEDVDVRPDAGDGAGRDLLDAVPGCEAPLLLVRQADPGVDLLVGVLLEEAVDPGQDPVPG